MKNNQIIYLKKKFLNLKFNLIFYTINRLLNFIKLLFFFA